jgi:phosphoribosylformimino-5-aminoimidazole carboxamide ribotide isomerase
MDLIPVIDVKNGLAVRAFRGRRAEYRPLETPLAQGSDPVAVARGLLALFPFSTLYVADLDGIEGRGASADLAERLTEALPGVAIWVDNGSLGAQRDAVTVIGSESVISADALAAVRGLPAHGFVLSLDFKGSEFAGPAALLNETTLWPERVIIMTLARVGSGEGPDLDRIAAIAARAGASRRVYAAGGIRHRADVEAARAAGAAGALIATALHAETITAGDLFEIAGRGFGLARGG